MAFLGWSVELHCEENPEDATSDDPDELPPEGANGVGSCGTQRYQGSSTGEESTRIIFTNLGPGTEDDLADVRAEAQQKALTELNSDLADATFRLPECPQGEFPEEDLEINIGTPQARISLDPSVPRLVVRVTIPWQILRTCGDEAD